MNTLQLISAGAAQALVTRLQERVLALYGYAIGPTFGAVGLMKDKLLAGAPCDVLILTNALIEQLTSSGHLAAGTHHRVTSGQRYLFSRCGQINGRHSLHERTQATRP